MSLYHICLDYGSYFCLIPKCDVAGTGAPAALITMLVATIFVAYFKGWTIRNPGLNIDRLLYTINDMLEERGFYGRFAALIIGIIDVESGRSVFCNAGDNIIHVSKKHRGKMIKVKFPETPAAGVFPSMMIEINSS